MTHKFTEGLRVLHHSAVRIEKSKIVYVDPFDVKDDFCDADIICVTHEHYDHFDPASITKCRKEDTHLVLPVSMKNAETDFDDDHIHYLNPDDECIIDGVLVKAVAAYNIGRPFHEKEKNWVGYVVTVDGITYYIAGDTDHIPEQQKIKCNVALLPVGGTYTMTKEAAADLANFLSPDLVVPTHYGSVVGENSDGAAFLQLLKDSVAGVELLENL